MPRRHIPPGSLPCERFADSDTTILYGRPTTFAALSAACRTFMENAGSEAACCRRNEALDQKARDDYFRELARRGNPGKVVALPTDLGL